MLLVFVVIGIWAYQSKRKAAIELKLAKENAEFQKRITEQFLTHTSHEIRTPLHIINSNVTDLTAHQEIAKKQAILASTEMLLKIANDILEISRLESGNLVLEYIPFSPSEIFSQIHNMLLPECKAKNLILEIEYGKLIPPLLINDPARIKQVVLNVVKNAIKFTEFGAIKIKIDYQNENLLLEIIDTGIGMDKTTLDNLFKSFNQGKLDTYRKFGGSGLGLFISHNLVKLMKGTIQISSQLNNGTNVAVAFPCKISEEFLFDNSRIETFKLNKLSALILDDDLMSRNVLENYLNKLEIQSESFSNGLQVLDFIVKSNVNIVFVDLNLLDENGTAICLKIKKLEPKMLVILTSGELVKNEAGCFDYQLEKPFGLAELNAAINEVINNEYDRAFGDEQGSELDKITIDTFKEELPKMVGLAKKYFDLKNYEKVKFYLHKMKPCFYYVDALDEFKRLEVLESRFDSLKPEEIEQMNTCVIAKLK